jgi:hypothetical protein
MSNPQQQICTELLYQPLTLIDCLHTFCGSCLKTWFSFKADAAERSPNPPSPGSFVYQCPSCRAPVRDTRHNATVASLLDMVLKANPDKGRSAQEKEEIARAYKPGDQVLRRLNVPERTAEERRGDEEDALLMEQVRQISLSEVGVGSSSLAPRPARRRESRSADGRARRSRDSSRDGRTRYTSERSGRPGDERERPRRSEPQAGERRDRRSGSRRSEDSSDSRQQRTVEHQSSLRSLISSGDMSERDIEREIEDFARQIQEEGLLDGLDLDNLDLSRNDELSRRITEAYRRRQRERTRHDRTRRSNASGTPRQPEQASFESRHSGGESSRPQSRQRPHSRSTSATSAVSFTEDRSRPPVSNSSTHLEVRTGERHRRRTGSSGRSSTTPVPAPAPPEARVTTRRSQTDLLVRTQQGDSSSIRPLFSEARSTSSPTVTMSTHHIVELPTGQELPFASRVPPVSSLAPATPPMAPSELPGTPQMKRANRPADLAIVNSAASNPLASPTSPGQQRPRSQLYQEPSVTCSRCSKQHIEYQLHYNCKICANGEWNICLDCYRGGKGCLHWFGFGYGAWNKWEKANAAANGAIERPHMLTANRYLPPKITPGGADGRRTLTADDPVKRLESGSFCARCFTWANECYWRCDICNEGDWGFCNTCVNQGNSCTHPLLPLIYQPTSSHTPPASPRMAHPPHAASVLTGPNVVNIGSFKPLTFATRCDICHDAIPSKHSRFHCLSCITALEPDAKPGEYEICTGCYMNLVSQKQISPENGHCGWRRCLKGHRMVVVAFQEFRGGLRRYIAKDLVGGRKLDAEAFESPEHKGQVLQKWTWIEADKKMERIVTKDVAATAPTTPNSAHIFPRDGGVGIRGTAKWSWYPNADDELLFPRGAEIRDIEEVSEEWFHGTYMGANGLFPAQYIRRLDVAGS